MNCPDAFTCWRNARLFSACKRASERLSRVCPKRQRRALAHSSQHWTLEGTRKDKRDVDEKERKRGATQRARRGESQSSRTIFKRAKRRAEGDASESSFHDIRSPLLRWPRWGRFSQSFRAFAMKSQLFPGNILIRREKYISLTR